MFGNEAPAHQDHLRPALISTMKSGLKSGHGAAFDHCLHHCGAWGDLHWGASSHRDL